MAGRRLEFIGLAMYFQALVDHCQTSALRGQNVGSTDSILVSFR